MVKDDNNPLNFCMQLASQCSITLHVNCKIAVFVNFQVLTMAKMDTKVQIKPGLNKYYPLFSRPQNGLASIGTSTKWNHARNFEPKMQVFTSKAKLSNFCT